MQDLRTIENPINDNSRISSPPPPLPYEYALLSKAAYIDFDSNGQAMGNTAQEQQENQQRLEDLKTSGWELAKFVASSNDYCASIWINSRNKQIVIAHRGSQNITSWVTDIESVVQLKPGSFVDSAVSLLEDEKVQLYRQQGYRLSTTGHSLGGFLAQICVAWSYRYERAASYYPAISAVTFDSPGASDFIDRVIIPTLKNQARSIKTELFNIHNFCAMPTLVSTYGKQLGTIWHLPVPNEQVSFAFLNLHKMQYLLDGFDSQTGQPRSFQRITDWPQADYSDYESLSKIVESFSIQALTLPFRFLNSLHKKIKGLSGTNPPRATWLDQVLRSYEPLKDFLAKTKNHNFHPTVEDLTNVSLAIHNHYSTFLDASGNKRSMDICHFDKGVQIFLADLINAQNLKMDAWGWTDHLKKIYGEEAITVFNQFRLVTHGEKTEIELLDSYAGSVFDYQIKLLTILCGKSIMLLSDFIGTLSTELKKEIIGLKEDLENAKPGSSLAKKLEVQLNEAQEKIAQLEERFKERETILGRSFAIRTASAFVAGAVAIRLLDQTDYDPARQQERDHLMRQAKDGDRVYIDGANAEAKDATAIVVAQQPTQAQGDFLERFGLLSSTKKNTTEPNSRNTELPKGSDCAKKS